jgi:hypothetical protein
MSGWSDVEQGRPELDWDVLVGDLDQASYLTTLGREVARRAVVGLGAGQPNRPATTAPACPPALPACAPSETNCAATCTRHRRSQGHPHHEPEGTHHHG